MTDADELAALKARVAALEQKTRFISIVEHVDPAYGSIFGMYIAGCRLGLNSDYWLRQNAGDGATFAIGNDFDWAGCYIENEGPQRNHTRPSVALAVNALAVGPQENRAIHAVAFNSTSCNAPVVTQIADRYVVMRYEGFEIRGSWQEGGFLLGRSQQDARRLW
jgi:hypothetical protein